MLAESLIENYSRIFGLTASVLRIFSAYGPFLDKMMFWDLLKKRQTAIACGMDVIEAFGTGVETRDFVHARDIAKAALLVAQSPEMGVTQIVNVGSGVETTVAEAANMLLSCLSRPIAVKFSGATREGDPTRWVADISRLKELGFVPDQPLVDGLREYAEWFRTCQP